MNRKIKYYNVQVIGCNNLLHRLFDIIWVLGLLFRYIVEIRTYSQQNDFNVGGLGRGVLRNIQWNMEEVKT